MSTDPHIFDSDKMADFHVVIHNALDRGLTIHPVRTRSKEPWLKAWNREASRSPEKIEEWCRRFPTSNYGVVADDNFLILESDDIHRLQDELGISIPSTYTVSARPGRPHFYFRQTEASRRAGNMDLPGVFEFKQNNRYVVGEGSVHPSGAEYVCINSADIIAIPDDLVEKLTRLKSGSRATVSSPAPPPGQKYGEGEGRQGFLMRTAAQLWDGVKTREELFAELQTINQAQCDPPKEEHKVLSMVDWIMQRSPNVRAGRVTFGAPQLDGERKKGTAFDFVLGPMPGETEGAFALGTVHLVIGSSGAGKTTFGIQMLQEQGRGHRFFDRETYNRQFLIIMQDRSEFELERTFRRMGIEKGAFPYISLTAAQSVLDPALVLEQIYKKAAVKPEILFVEGLDMWCPDAVDMKKVVPLLANLQEFAKYYHISLIATVGAPKTKPKEQYASPRDRAFGSAAWARRCDTVLDITVDEESQKRKVWLLLRNAKPQKYTMRFEDGLLVLQQPTIITGEDKSPKQIAQERGISERQAQRIKKSGRLS